MSFFVCKNNFDKTYYVHKKFRNSQITNAKNCNDENVTNQNYSSEKEHGVKQNCSTSENFKMPCCTAPRCGNNSSTTKGITFHSFPLSRPHMVQRWLECLQAQGKKKEWKPNHWSKVCGCHFEERFIIRLTQVRLKDEAIPTIFDPIPETEKKSKTSTTLQDNQLITKNSNRDFSTKVLEKNSTLITQQYKQMSIHTNERVPKLIALDSPELLSAREALVIQRSNHTESFASNPTRSEEDIHISHMSTSRNFTEEKESTSNKATTTNDSKGHVNKLINDEKIKELDTAKSLSAIELSATQITDYSALLNPSSSFSAIQTEFGKNSVFPNAISKTSQLDPTSVQHLNSQNVVSSITRQIEISHSKNINNTHRQETQTNIIHTSYQIPHQLSHLSPTSLKSNERKFYLEQTKTLEVYSESSITSKDENNKLLSEEKVNHKESGEKVQDFESLIINDYSEVNKSTLVDNLHTRNTSFANYIRQDIIAKLKNREIFGNNYMNSYISLKRNVNKSKQNVAKHKASISNNLKTNYNSHKSPQIQHQFNSRAHNIHLFQGQMQGGHQIFGHERLFRFRKHKFSPYYVHFAHKALSNTSKTLNVEKSIKDMNKESITSNYKCLENEYKGNKYNKKALEIPITVLDHDSFNFTESSVSTNLKHQKESTLKCLLSGKAYSELSNLNLNNKEKFCNETTSNTLLEQHENNNYQNTILDDIPTGAVRNVMSSDINILIDTTEIENCMRIDKKLQKNSSSEKKLKLEQSYGILESKNHNQSIKKSQRSKFHNEITPKLATIINFNESESNDGGSIILSTKLSESMQNTDILDSANKYLNSDITEKKLQERRVTTLENTSHKCTKMLNKLYALQTDLIEQNVISNEKNNLSFKTALDTPKNTAFVTGKMNEGANSLDIKYLTAFSGMKSKKEYGYYSEGELQESFFDRKIKRNEHENLNNEYSPLHRVYSPETPLIRKAYSENCINRNAKTQKMDERRNLEPENKSRRIKRSQSHSDVRSFALENIREPKKYTFQLDIHTDGSETSNQCKNKEKKRRKMRSQRKTKKNTTIKGNADNTSSKNNFSYDYANASEVDSDDLPLIYSFKSRYRQCRKRTSRYVIDSDVSSDDEMNKKSKERKKLKKKCEVDKDYKPSLCNSKLKILITEERASLKLKIPPFVKKQKDAQFLTAEYWSKEDDGEIELRDKTCELVEAPKVEINGMKGHKKAMESPMNESQHKNKHRLRHKRRKSMSDQGKSLLEKALKGRIRSKSQPPSKARSSKENSHHTLNAEEVAGALTALKTISKELRANDTESSTTISSVSAEVQPQNNLKRKQITDINENVLKKVKHTCKVLSSENLLNNLKYKLHCLIWMIIEIMRTNKKFFNHVIHEAGFGDSYMQYLNTNNVKQKLFLFPRHRNSNESLVFEDLFPLENSYSKFNLKELYQTFKEIKPDENTIFIIITNTRLHNTLLKNDVLVQKNHDLFDRKYYKFDQNEKILNLLNNDVTEQCTAVQFLNNLQIVDDSDISESFIITKLADTVSNFDARKMYAKLFTWAEEWLKNKTGKIEEFEDILFQCRCNKRPEKCSFSINANLNFVGRQDELNLLKNEFNCTSKQLSIITGIPGIGKTELVTQFLKMQRDDLDEIIWLNGTCLKEDIRSAACSLGLKQCNNYHRAIRAICNFLKDKKFAIVLDNIQASHSLPQDILYLLNLQKSQIIMATSRNINWYGFKTIRLEPIEKEDSSKLLTELLQIIECNTNIEIKDLLGQVFDITRGIPIALHLAAASIRAGAEAFSILGQSTSIGRSLQSCLTRIRNISTVTPGNFGNYHHGIVAFYELARRNAILDHNENIAGTLLEILASVRDTCFPLRCFLPIVQVFKEIDSPKNDLPLEFDDESDLLLAKAAKILVSQGLIHISNGMAKLSHSIIGELTTENLSIEGRKAQIVNYVLLLAQTRIKDIPSFSPQPKYLWNLALTHLELLIKHYRKYLDFLESSSENEKTYRAMANKILALDSHQPRILSANIWSRLRIARCLWNVGKIQEGEKLYNEAIEGITTSIDLQDAFFMRSYRLVCRINDLSNDDVNKEIEDILIYLVPMNLSSEPRHLRYIYILAQALGRVGRNYQAWELYEVIWKHITNLQQDKLEGGPSMCDVMSSAGPLAWSKLPENKIFSTLMSCNEESEVKKKIKLLEHYITWAQTIENKYIRKRSVEMFNQVLQQSYSCKKSFLYLMELWEHLCTKKLSYAAAIVLEAIANFPNMLRWQYQIVVGIQKLFSYDYEECNEGINEMINVSSNLPNWSFVLEQLFLKSSNNSQFSFGIIILEKIWELTISSPTLGNVSKLPMMFQRILKLAGKQLDGGRYKDAFAIYKSLSAKMQFIAQNGIDEMPGFLSFIPEFGCLEDPKSAIKIERLKIDLEKLFIHSHDDPENPNNKTNKEVLENVELFKIVNQVMDTDESNNTEIKLRQSVESLRICEEALKSHSDQDDSIQYLNLLYNKACILQSLGYLEEALNSSLEVLKKLEKKLKVNHPHILRVTFLKASILETMFKYDDALNVYNILYERQACTLGKENCESLRTKGRIASVYECKGQSEVALEIMDDLLVKQRTRLGIEHSNTLALMFDRACLLKKQFKFQESSSAFQEVLKIRTEKFGAMHIDTLRTKHKLASVLSYLEYFEKSLRLFADLIESQVKLLGENHPFTLNAMHDKAQVFFLKHEYANALDAYQLVLAQKIDTQGSAHPSTLLTKEAIARTLLKMNKFSKALDIYDDILLSTKCMHFSLSINALNGKAYIYEKMGKLDESLTILLSLEKQQATVFDSDYKSSLILTEKIASIYSKKGEYKVSIELYSNILEKSRYVYGSKHQCTQNVIFNLATVYSQSGDFDEALALFGELLLNEQEFVSNDCNKYLLVKENIAMLLECKNDFVKSQQMYEEIIATKERLLPEDDPSTIASICRLGLLLQKQNKTEEVRNISKKLLSFQNEALLDTCYAPFFYISGHFARSLSLFDKNLQEKKHRLGSVHPSTIATMEGKAAALVGCKRREDALKLLNEVFLLRSELFGEFDPSTLTTKSRIATILSEQQVLVPALEMFEEILSVQQNILGINHPDTITTTLNRNIVLEMQKEYDAALSSYETLLIQRKAELGIKHKEVINIEIKLAKLFVKKGMLKKGISNYEVIIKKLKDIYGVNHDETIQAIFKKACALERGGKYDMAMAEFQNILKVQNEKTNVNHAEIFVTKFKICNLYSKLGQIDSGLNLIDQVIYDKKSIYGFYHIETILSMIQRTEILGDNKRFDEAILEYNKMIDLLLNKYGDKHKITLLVKSKYATLIEQTGDLQRSIEIFEDLKSQQFVVFGSDHPETLISEYHMSILLQRQGKLVESLKHLHHITEVGAARIGDRHHLIITAKQQLVIVLTESGEYIQALAMYKELHNIGMKSMSISVKRSVAFALESLGQISKSIATYEEILKSLEDEFGTTHSSTLALKSKIALLLESNGESAKSSKYQKEVLEICRKRFPSNHATTLSLSHNHATKLLMSSDDLRHTLNKYMRNLKKEIGDLGENHPNTMLTRNGIALVHAKQGSFSKAKTELQEILASQKKTLSNDDLDVLITRHNLATVLELQGNKEEALKEFQEILTLRRLKLGPNHQQTLLTQARVAALREKLNYSDGTDALKEVLDLQREFLGTVHSDTLASLHVLIHAYEHSKAYKKALDTCEELIAAYVKKSKGGTEHLSALHHSVWLLEKLKNFTKAAHRCQDLWQLRKDSRGELDESTLAARAHLACIYANQNNLDLACKIYREVLAHQEETLGKEHPQSLVTLHNLIHVLQRQKRNSREVRRLAHSLKLRREESQKSRPDKSLLRPCLISETERIKTELAAVNMEMKEPLFPKIIPHIPI